MHGASASALGPIRLFSLSPFVVVVCCCLHARSQCFPLPPKAPCPEKWDGEEKFFIVVAVVVHDIYIYIYINIYTGKYIFYHFTKKILKFFFPVCHDSKVPQNVKWRELKKMENEGNFY